MLIFVIMILVFFITVATVDIGDLILDFFIPILEFLAPFMPGKIFLNFSLKWKLVNKHFWQLCL